MLKAEDAPADVGASKFHAKATTATTRAQLPQNWPWADPWHELFTTACGPPAPAT